MKRLLVLVALATGLISHAYGQTYPGQFPANTVFGNATGSTAVPVPGAVINSQMANAAAGTLKCKPTGASSGPPQDCAYPVINVTDAPYSAVCDGVTDDHTPFINALTALSSAGGGVLVLPARTCALSKLVSVPSNTTIQGQGMDVSFVKMIGTLGGGIFTTLGTSPQNTNITYQDFTCNVNSVDTCIQAQYVTNFTARRLHIENVKTWGILVGVLTGTDPTIRNFNVLIEDSVFDTQQSTFESVVLLNSQYATVRRNRFLGGNTAPGLGLFQNLDKVVVDGNEFTGYSIGAYYTQSTNNIKISHNFFHDMPSCLQGANQSDNGNFGFLVVNNISVEYNDFFNCTNIGAQLGAIDGGSFIGNRLTKNLNALVFDKGNNTGPGPAPNAAVANFVVANNSFWDNNPGATLPVSHAPVVFQNIGGNVNQTWTGNEFWDDQVTPTQLDPITFNGAFTWSGINFVGGSIQPYSGGSSFNLAASAIVSGISVVNSANISGLPAGVSAYNLGNNHIGQLGAHATSATSCGTSPGTPIGTDSFGQVLEGSTATGCTINFAVAYASAPVCVANLQTANAVAMTASTTTSVTFAHTSLSGNVITWACFGQ